MKKRFLFLITLLLLIQLQPHAQITITRSDMPDIGDTLRISTTTVLTGIDPAPTGPDHTWDFSSLEPVSQTVEQYLSINVTPFLYQIVFNQNVANLASPVTEIGFIPDFEISDAYIYYRATTGSYTRPGYAATIMGIPIPMKFDQAELLYTFPLQYDSPADSSLSNYSLDIPGIGYFSIDRKRVNQVDGWGSLTTPYGTFDALRVKSTVYERDSLYLDSIQTGFPVIRNYIEYQWLGAGQGVPLLTISQEGSLLTARYRDSIRNLNPMILSAQDTTLCQGDSVTLKVEVNGGTPPYTYLWSTGEQTASIRVSPDQSTSYVVAVTDSLQQSAFASIDVTVYPFEQFSPGADTLVCADASIIFDAGQFYENVRWYMNDVLISQNHQLMLDSTGIGLNSVTIRVEFETENCSGADEITVGFYICGGIAEGGNVPLDLYPNPANRIINVDTKAFGLSVDCSVSASDGSILKNLSGLPNTGQIELDVSTLKPGTYFLLVTDKKKSGAARFLKH